MGRDWEKNRQRMREYYKKKKNDPEFQRKLKERRLASRGKNKIYQKQYRAEHKEEKKEYMQQYSKDNKDKLQEQKIVWYHRTKDTKGYKVNPRSRFTRYRAGAKHRGLVFEITQEEAYQLFKGDCHYCGTPPDPLSGIDRVNNDEGYTTNNVVSCCGYCNRMKNKYSEDHFTDHIAAIYHHYAKQRILDFPI